jgi:4'-phosphopantetheinyl transferase
MEAFAAFDAPTAEIHLNWPAAPHSPQLVDGEVHVWSARLFRPDFDHIAALETLSEAERQRSALFHFERDRKSFISRRSMLRLILAHYLLMEPSRITLVHEERGKPRLSEADSPFPLHFNFSHSRNLALLAVSRFSPVGVDVEKIRPMPEMSEIAATFLSKQEKVLFNAVEQEQKLEVFFGIWTRKESYLKVTGEGIARALAEIDCSQAPAGLALYPLSPAPGFIGALAIGAGAALPHCWQWMA